MDRPISILINDFKQSLINDINNCGLPVAIAEIIFKDVYTELKDIALKQSASEMQQYEMSKNENQVVETTSKDLTEQE